MKIYHTDQFLFPLPAGHRFPIAKYASLRRRIVEDKSPVAALYVPDAATDEELLRAHAADYLQRAKDGKLSAREVRALGFPWSPQLVHRARRSAGATIAACRAALGEGLAVNLAGGTHHAFGDRGEGFCLFNDSAVAARAMLAEHRVRRVAIIDCDVHQGNGTAALFAGDSAVYTFSIHGRNNYPTHKEHSDLDIGLNDGAEDAQYLTELRTGLRHALATAAPDLAIYLAGADPYGEDRFGRLALSKDGLAERDRLVLDLCHEAGAPVAITMAGGYGKRIEDTVDIHFQTVSEALRRAAG